MYVIHLYDLKQCGILTNVDSDELVHLETPNGVRSVAIESWNIQATGKGFDQTARMHRPIWANAGRTYHNVGNLIHLFSVT